MTTDMPQFGHSFTSPIEGSVPNVSQSPEASSRLETAKLAVITLQEAEKAMFATREIHPNVQLILDNVAALDHGNYGVAAFSAPRSATVDTEVHATATEVTEISSEPASSIDQARELLNGADITFLDRESFETGLINA